MPFFRFFVPTCVSEEVDSTVTHVVAARTRSSKVDMARRLGVPAVHVSWLFYCFTHYARPDEQIFALSPELEALWTPGDKTMHNGRPTRDVHDGLLTAVIAQHAGAGLRAAGAATGAGESGQPGVTDTQPVHEESATVAPGNRVGETERVPLFTSPSTEVAELVPEKGGDAELWDEAMFADIAVATPPGSPR
jgi:hypothetical protein